MELKEGDRMQLGGSSRVYRLHWVPISHAYDLENPFVPTLGESEPEESTHEEQHKVSRISILKLNSFRILWFSNSSFLILLSFALTLSCAMQYAFLLIL